MDEGAPYFWISIGGGRRYLIDRVRKTTSELDFSPFEMPLHMSSFRAHVDLLVRKPMPDYELDLDSAKATVYCDQEIFIGRVQPIDWEGRFVAFRWSGDELPI